MGKRKLVSWEWQGDCKICNSHVHNGGGYIQICINGKPRRLHRVVYAAHHGKIQNGMVIRHTCNNPSCFTLQHLEIGTQADNMRDQVKSGRSRTGTKHHFAKITEAEVWSIRYQYPELRNIEVGAVFGISHKHVSAIRNNKTWKHIKFEDYYI